MKCTTFPRPRFTTRRSPQGERGLKYKALDVVNLRVQSLPTGGAWIEIFCQGCNKNGCPSSLPTGGAWIEIQTAQTKKSVQSCRSPQGERGLKFRTVPPGIFQRRRSPQGERGLKCPKSYEFFTTSLSLPTGGAWIEIMVGAVRSAGTNGRSPQGERGLKLLPGKYLLGQTGRSPQGERGLK